METNLNFSPINSQSLIEQIVEQVSAKALESAQANEANVTFETMPRAIEQLLAEVREIKAKINAPAVTPTPKRDRLLLNEALALLDDLGRPTSKSTLYKETSTGVIPHYKVGKRLVFSRKTLTQWVEQGMPDPS